MLLASSEDLVWSVFCMSMALHRVVIVLSASVRLFESKNFAVFATFLLTVHRAPCMLY